MKFPINRFVEDLCPKMYSLVRFLKFLI
jgi:hypothetical protein